MVTTIQGPSLDYPTLVPFPREAHVILPKFSDVLHPDKNLISFTFLGKAKISKTNSSGHLEKFL